MKLKTALMFALGIAIVAPASVDAAALTFLPKNGIQTKLEDDDWEVLVNDGDNVQDLADSDTVIDDGDFFVGMLRISNLQQPSGTEVHDFNEMGGETFSAIFAIKISKISSTSFAASSLSDTEWDDVGMNDLGYSRNSSSTIAIVYDDPNNIAPDAGSVVDSLQTVGGTELWEFGDSGAGNFWAISSIGGDDIADAGGGNFATFNAGLDVTHTFGAAVGAPLAFQENSFLGSVFGPGSSQLLLTGSNQGGEGDFVDVGLTSDTNLFLVAVPEPGSLTMLACFGAGVLGIGYRRRRAAKKNAV